MLQNPWLSGPDYAKYWLHSDDIQSPVDEIEDFWKAQYLSAGECVWQLMGFHITWKKPAVGALSLHLPSDRTHHQYHRNNDQNSTLLLLDHYFARPHGTFVMHKGAKASFENLTYSEYFLLFHLAKYDSSKAHQADYYLEQENRDGSPLKHVILHDPQHQYIMHLHGIPPASGELFYLHTILQCHLTAFFMDVWTVNSLTFDTYQSVAVELGIFTNKQEARYALLKAIQTLHTPWQIWLLFVHLLINNCVPTPIQIWDTFKEHMAQDYII